MNNIPLPLASPLSKEQWSLICRRISNEEVRAMRKQLLKDNVIHEPKNKHGRFFVKRNKIIRIYYDYYTKKLN